MVFDERKRSYLEMIDRGEEREKIKVVSIAIKLAAELMEIHPNAAFDIGSFQSSYAKVRKLDQELVAAAAQFLLDSDVVIQDDVVNHLDIQRFKKLLSAFANHNGHNGTISYS